MSEPRRFPPDPASVPAARDFVAESLAGLAEEQVEIILLATSELAANSVRHAATEFTVTVSRDVRSVRVVVEDGGAGEPVVQHPDAHAPSGRGLLIVDRLSDDWGSDSDPGHNRVWFSVRIGSTGASSRASHQPAPPPARHRRPRAGDLVIGHRYRFGRRPGDLCSHLGARGATGRHDASVRRSIGPAVPA